MAMAKHSFNDLNKKYEEQKAAEEAARNYSSDYEAPSFECCILGKGQAKVLRWADGIPIEDDNAVVKVKTCWFRDAYEGGKMFSFILSPDENHPMNQLIKTVKGKYTWIEEKKEKDYENKGCRTFQIWNHPSLNPKFKGSADPSTQWFVNVIDRSDSWCKDNKHTKLLCWGSSDYEYTKKDGTVETGTNIEYGCRQTFWKDLWKKCTDYSAHPYDQDFLVYHYTGEAESGDSFKTLNILHPEEKTAITKYSKKLNTITEELYNKLSDAEKSLYTEGDEVNGKKTYFKSLLLDVVEDDDVDSYEKYNFKDIMYITKPTNAEYLLKKMGWYFKMVDAEKGTNYLEQFTALAAKEKAEWVAAHPKKEGEETTTQQTGYVTEPVEETPASTPVVTETEAAMASQGVPGGVEPETQEELPNFVPPAEPTPAQTVPTRAARTPTAQVNLQLFPHWNDLTDNDKKAYIVNADGSLELVNPNTACGCSECGCNLNSTDSFTCPQCGAKF